MTDKSLSTLPTEVLYNIMNNVDTRFIIFSFRRVCKRFKAISAVYNQYILDLGSMSQSCLKRISRSIEPDKITSLILNNELDESVGIKLFFSLFDISQLTRLRSITLGKLKDRKDYELLNHLDVSGLISLNIHSGGRYESDALPFISKVLTQQHLCNLNLIKSDYTITKIPWSSSCSIVYLTIKSCSLKEYDLILQCLSRLRTIVTAQFIMDQSNVFITSSSASTRYSQLVSLVIGNSSLSMTDFQLLLSLTPSLVRLKLMSHRSKLDSILDGSDWADLIQTKLPDLKIFQIFFSYTLLQGNDAKDLDLLMDRFRTPFWLQEKIGLSHVTMF
jgi:hypothetical protein